MSAEPNVLRRMGNTGPWCKVVFSLCTAPNDTGTARRASLTEMMVVIAAPLDQLTLGRGTHTRRALRRRSGRKAEQYLCPIPIRGPGHVLARITWCV